MAELIWEHDLVLAGQSGHIRMTLDSEGTLISAVVPACSGVSEDST